MEERQKQNVTYPFNGIVFSHQKEQSISTCYNVDEPWKHYAKRKKPVTKCHLVYDSIYMISCAEGVST